jgi:predicted molibdopterin-dependent oxidoreductase YjgC
MNVGTRGGQIVSVRPVPDAPVNKGHFTKPMIREHGRWRGVSWTEARAFVGTDGLTALINLALLTGNIGRPGTGLNPLRGQNNVQGAAHRGATRAPCPDRCPSIRAGRCSSACGARPFRGRVA